jgi:Zn-dependent protease/CBS domain-containing protein
MKATIPLGRYAGVPVGAHWSVLVTVVVLADLLAVGILPAAVPGLGPLAYWVTAVGVTVLFLASLLGHELAHAALARRLGIRVRSITLWMLGGAAVFEDEPSSPHADALVAGVGPATSAAFAGMFLVLAGSLSPEWLSGLPVAALSWLAVVNLLLAGFNLLPAAPLDGGRLLRAWLWQRSGDRDRAAATAGAVGQALGFALVGIGILEMFLWGSIGGLWLAFVGWFVAAGASAERTQALILGKLGHAMVGDVATPHPIVAPGWFTIDGFLDQVSEQGLRHRVFPVTDFTGAPVGVISLHDLITARPDTHRNTRVQDVARPLNQRSLALADEPLADLLRRAVLRSGVDAVVVLRDRRLAGIVTAADIAWALELARLGRPPHRAPADSQLS